MHLKIGLYLQTGSTHWSGGAQSFLRELGRYRGRLPPCFPGFPSPSWFSVQELEGSGMCMAADTGPDSNACYANSVAHLKRCLHPGMDPLLQPCFLVNHSPLADQVHIRGMAFHGPSQGIANHSVLHHATHGLLITHGWQRLRLLGQAGGLGLLLGDRTGPRGYDIQAPSSGHKVGTDAHGRYRAKRQQKQKRFPSPVQKPFPAGFSRVRHLKISSWILPAGAVYPVPAHTSCLLPRSEYRGPVYSKTDHCTGENRNLTSIPIPTHERAARRSGHACPVVSIAPNPPVQVLVRAGDAGRSPRIKYQSHPRPVRRGD